MRLLSLTRPRPRNDRTPAQIFKSTLRHTKRVALMISEEDDEPTVVDGADHAKYIAAFDPLDGR